MEGSVRDGIDQGAERLFPGYFAVVMATGIVSIGTQPISRLLFQINIAAYAIVWVLTLVRLFRYFTRVASDLADYHRGPGFFTMVAGTSILGSQFVIFSNGIRAGALFWLFALFLWLLLTYTFFTAVVVRDTKPGFMD